ncbi:hypothetical protein HGM15179_007648 [Zosterops borbonicus]|uniref:Uncharacterized protein n=1 Tax=Zosterops borbonicus TaxID=364589 RepID=A0A8K1LM91_9PASS|nr:hypothetical protein HGM15179_007648 [Zosterops borbonicus]
MNRRNARASLAPSIYCDRTMVLKREPGGSSMTSIGYLIRTTENKWKGETTLGNLLMERSRPKHLITIEQQFLDHVRIWTPAGEEDLLHFVPEGYYANNQEPY